MDRLPFGENVHAREGFVGLYPYPRIVAWARSTIHPSFHFWMTEEREMDHTRNSLADFATAGNSRVVQSREAESVR